MSMVDYGTTQDDTGALNRTASLTPVPKVVVSTLSTGVGGAIAIVILGLLRRAGLELNAEEIGAVITLVSCACSFVGGYMTPAEGFRRSSP
jgi:hypothetical protein